MGRLSQTIRQDPRLLLTEVLKVLGNRRAQVVPMK